jgi:hypothetical protein
MEANPNLSPAITHQPSLLGGAENMKLLFDDVQCHLSRTRGVSSSHDNAWETLRYQIAHDSQVVKHLAQLQSVTAGQTGDTANQQTVSPVRTATADNVAAGATPANRVVDEGGAVAATAVDSATVQATLANVTSQIGELVSAVTGLTALVAQIVKNAQQAPAPAA